MVARHRRQLTEMQEKAFMYLRLHRYQAAEELLKDALEEHGPLANLLNLLGLVYHKQSLFPQALEYFDKAREANPLFLEASLNLSVTLSDLGFYEQAEKVFNEMGAALEQRTNLPDVVLGRLANLHNRTALGYEQAGLWQEAIYEYQKALQIFERMPDVRLRLAKLCIKLEAFIPAKEQLSKILEDNPQNFECLNLLGAVAYKMGDQEEASRFWQTSQSLSPTDKTSRTYLRTLMHLPDRAS